MDEMKQLTEMADRLKGRDMPPDEQTQMGDDLGRMIDQMKSMRAIMMDGRRTKG